MPEVDFFNDAKDDRSESPLSDQDKAAIDQAKEHFRKGDYGLAEQNYRTVVEQRPNHVEAWIGLAATYDHLKRFDEADRAYEVVVKLAGNTASVLNNLGYHLMLKGNFKQAEATLHKAEDLDPKNPYIKNNLRILARWRASAGGFTN